jgi:predicted HTH domain antitoxin
VSLSLEIPDEVLQTMRLPPAETKSRLQLELAISLYAREILSLGKAAELAGISRLELNDVLSKRGVPMHYTQEDLSNDLAYARDGQ